MYLPNSIPKIVTLFPIYIYIYINKNVMHDEGPPASLSLGALGHVLGQGRTISKYKSHQTIEEFMKFKTQQILLFTLWN